MEALASAYASDEDDEAPSIAPPQHQDALLPVSIPFIGPQERPSESVALPLLAPQVASSFPAIPVLGRYVSKRERAAMASTSSPPAHIPPPVTFSAGTGPFIGEDMPMHVEKKLKRFVDGGKRCQPPKGLSMRLKGHTKAVTAVRWSPVHGSLLASAGMDCVAHIWNVWKQHKACTLSSHTAAIKDIQWSTHGGDVLSCGFDQTSRLIDVETGWEKQVFKEDQYVNVVKYHPIKSELFLSGGSKGVLRLWDIRTGTVVQEYHKGLGPVMDVDFSHDGKQFVSTSDIANRNSSDKTILVWDFETQIPLSNQVYLEAYTCPCVRYHPYESAFVAQSNGNYIAIFSGYSPFKLNKYKRFEGHLVSGYRVQCSFSPDGAFLVSGSSDGQVYIYYYRSTKVLKVLEAHTDVCSDVSCHPSMASVIASGGWDGNVCIFE